MTAYLVCMTMLSFRTDELQASQAQDWADRLGIHRSDLIREALRRHLIRLASERDAETWGAATRDSRGGFVGW